jgi:hypothetical protein
VCHEFREARVGEVRARPGGAGGVLKVATARRGNLGNLDAIVAHRPLLALIFWGGGDPVAGGNLWHRAAPNEAVGA